MGESRFRYWMKNSHVLYGKICIRREYVGPTENAKIKCLGNDHGLQMNE